MDSNNSTPPDLPLPQEGTGGHDLWPIDDGGILSFENGATGGIGGSDRNLGGHTLTIDFQLRNGIISRTFNAATAYTDDMFASQDPELCASGPNDLQADMSETQDIYLNALGPNDPHEDMSETQDIYLNALGPNDPHEDMSEDQEFDLHALGPNDPQSDMFETQEIYLNALGPNDPHEDMSEIQELHLHALGPNDPQADMSQTQDMSQTPDLYSQEDDGPEPSNKMEDYPTPPELRFETKSKYDELTPCTSDDEEIVSPLTAIARRVRAQIGTLRPIPKLTDLTILHRLTAEEEESQDYIYDDMPDLEYSVNKKEFTTTTDEDTDADYSEYPLHSNTSRTNDSSNGKKRFKCKLCTRPFNKAGSLIQHLYWHDDESKQQAVSDSSEDIPILSSGEETVTEIHHSSGGQIVGSSPIKELTLNNFISVYGNAFIAANHKYVTDFLTELHKRKYML